MPVGSAATLVEDTQGYEKRTSGLWMHSGQLIVRGGPVDLPNGSISTAELAPGAAVTLSGFYQGTPNVTTTQGTWFEVVASRLTATFTGKPCAIDISVSLTHSVGSAGLYLGWMLDSGAQTYTFGQNYTPNALVPMAFNTMGTPTAGTHTISIGILTFTAGTLTLSGNGFTTLRVLELRGS